MSPGKNLATQTYKFIDGYPKRKCFSKLKTSLLMLLLSGKPMSSSEIN